MYSNEPPTPVISPLIVSRVGLAKKITIDRNIDLEHFEISEKLNCTIESLERGLQELVEYDKIDASTAQQLQSENFSSSMANP